MASKGKKHIEIAEESTLNDWLHRLKTHPFLFIGTLVVLVIVIVAFVLVPAIVPNVQRGVDLTFGYYDKVPIKYVRDNYFYQVQQSIARNQQSDSDDPNSLYAQAMIWRQAFEETVVHTGILDEMKKAGNIIPDTVVDRTVAALPQFQDNGRFSVTRWSAMDNNSRMSLWRQVQESVQIQSYVSDLSGIRSSSKEASFISSMASPQRDFDLAIFPFSSYPDSEIISYAKANPALFTVVHLSRITINSSEKEAQKILDSVTNGTSTFEEAARASSQDTYADKSGDMGIRMAYELASDIPDEQDRGKIASLTKGSMSSIVKVTSGWAFFRAEDAAIPADTSDSSQLDKIRSYIMTNSRGNAEDWLIAQANSFTAQAKEKGFSEAASAGSIKTSHLTPIPVNYGNAPLFASVTSSGISELANAGTNQFFWKAAFTTPLKSPSTPLVIGDNVIVLFPLEESTADTNQTQMIEMYFPYWMNSGMDQELRTYFLTSDKLDDRFNETFWRIFGRNTQTRASP